MVDAYKPQTDAALQAIGKFVAEARAKDPFCLVRFTLEEDEIRPGNYLPGKYALYGWGAGHAFKELYPQTSSSPQLNVVLVEARRHGSLLAPTRCALFYSVVDQKSGTLLDAGILESDFPPPWNGIPLDGVNVVDRINDCTSTLHRAGVDSFEWALGKE